MRNFLSVILGLLVLFIIGFIAYFWGAVIILGMLAGVALAVIVIFAHIIGKCLLDWAA